MTQTNDPKTETQAETQTPDVWAELQASGATEPAASEPAPGKPAPGEAKASAGTGKARQARKPAAKKASSSKKTPAKGSGGRKPAVTLEDIARGYIRALQEREASAGTLFSYQMELNLAQDELGADTSAKKLTQKVIEDFFESDRVTKKRNGKPKAKPSIDKTRRVLRQALLWAEEAGLIEKSPVQKPERKGKRVSS